MRNLLVLFFFLPFLSSAQEKDTTKVKDLKADIKLYKTFNLEKDTIVIDTSLTIHDEYKYNYLRKDNFGLFSFSNEAYLYNQLDFSKKKTSILPQFGFNAKHITYLDNNDIFYYSVPTPLTDIYFKTVMRQGQSLDALLSVNTKPNLNFTVAYKSVRSIGDYFNNLSSSGHFRFITSYHSPNKKYYLHANFVGQDILNQENGGISDPTQLDGTNQSFSQRERVDVYFNDASSKLKGNRYFIDQSYQFTKGNSLVIKHQMYYENKFYEYIQLTKSLRLGEALYNSVNNKTNFNVFYNKAGVSFTTKKLGEIYLFIDNYSFNQFYRIPDETIYVSTIPYNYHNRINNIGGQYDFNHNKWNFHILLQNAISTQPSSNYEAFAKYKFDENQYVKISAQQISKIPDNIFVFNQSDYNENYDWLNSFKNEKQSILKVETKNKWFEASVQLSNLNDYLFFYNTEERIDSLVVKPFQYDKSIQYFAAEIAKEIKYRNWALDNRVKFQQVEQSDKVLNVPQIITRNTLYYTKAVFKKAMLLQTGVTVNYFAKYFADDYVPVIGEFYTQNLTKVGGFPVLDFFVNARVRQTRIYLKAEHFNALFTNKVDYYNTPNYPFRDFHIRFGLEWNFFK